MGTWTLSSLINMTARTCKILLQYDDPVVALIRNQNTSLITVHHHAPRVLQLNCIHLTTGVKTGTFGREKYLNTCFAIFQRKQKQNKTWSTVKLQKHITDLTKTRLLDGDYWEQCVTMKYH